MGDNACGRGGLHCLVHQQHSEGSFAVVEHDHGVFGKWDKDGVKYNDS